MSMRDHVECCSCLIRETPCRSDPEPALSDLVSSATSQPRSSTTPIVSLIEPGCAKTVMASYVVGLLLAQQLGVLPSQPRRREPG